MLFLKPAAFSKQQMTADDIINNSQAIAINGAAYYGPTIEKHRKAQSDKFINIPELDTQMKMLQRKRVQAVVGEYDAGCHSFNKHSDSKLGFIKVNQTDIFFMLNKKGISAEFIRRFNQVIQQQLSEGIFAKLQKKYTSLGCD